MFFTGIIRHFSIFSVVFEKFCKYCTRFWLFFYVKHFVVKSNDFDRFMTLMLSILAFTSKTGQSVEHTKTEYFDSYFSVRDGKATDRIAKKLLSFSHHVYLKHQKSNSMKE